MSLTTRKDAMLTESQMKLAIAQTLSQSFAYNAPVVVMDFSVNDQGEFEGKFKDVARPRVFSFNIKGQSVTFKPHTPGRMDSVDDWEEFSSGYSYRVDAGIRGNKKPQCVKPTAYNCGKACINIKNNCKSSPEDSQSQERLEKLKSVGKDYAKTTKTTPKPKESPETTAKKPPVSTPELKPELKPEPQKVTPEIKKQQSTNLIGDGTHDGTPENAREYYDAMAKSGKKISMKEAEDTVGSINYWTGKGSYDIREDQKAGQENEHADRIDNFIKNSTPYKGEIYRGINFSSEEEAMKWAKGDKDGIVGNQSAHASWSSDVGIATTFTELDFSGEKPTQVILKTTNKSGASIRNLSAFGKPGASKLGKDEKEVVVSKNTRHKFKSATKKDGILYIEVEEVDPLPEKGSAKQKKEAKTPKEPKQKTIKKPEDTGKNTNPVKTELKPSPMSREDQAKVGSEWLKTAKDFVAMAKQFDKLPPNSVPNQVEKKQKIDSAVDSVSDTITIASALETYGKYSNKQAQGKIDVISLNDKAGKTQGFFIVDNEESKDSMYIGYLGANPMNAITGKKGAGKQIIYYAIQESIKKGFKGRIKLEALEGAVPFYKVVGFQEKTSKDNEDDVYMELSEESAKAFVEEYEKKLK